MKKEFNVLSKETKYDICKRALEAAQKLFQNQNKDDFSFQTVAGYVNLLSVRGFKNGEAVKSKNTVFDDTLFVVYTKNGEKIVEEYEISTEFGSDGTAILQEGQYRYSLGIHGSSHYPKNQPLKNGFAQQHNYRALKINQIEGATVLRDTNRNMELDSDEEIQTGNLTINIHYGGESESTSNWSIGCQVIRGWDNFIKIMKVIESDYSILGTIDNELVEKPAADGTRYILYTLLSGTEFEKYINSPCTLPIILSQDNELTNDNITKYYSHTEKETEGGYFPVGSNTLWHGGLHIFTDEGSDVFACMPGKVVAGRLADNTTLANGPHGHRNFLLLQHEIKGKPCYSLYMHLKENPLIDTDEFVKKVKWLSKPGKKSYKITATTRNYRSSTDSSKKANEKGTNVLGSLNKDQVVEFVEDASPAPWKKVKLADGKIVFLSCDLTAVQELTTQEIDKDLLDSLKKGDVVKIDKEIQAGDILWKSGKYGPKDGMLGLIHWEIFSTDDLTKESSAASTPVSTAKPAGLEKGYKAGGGIKVRGITGPASAKTGENITCAVTKINFADAPESELQSIKWKVFVDGVEKPCDNHGHIFQFTIPLDSAGKEIKIYPYVSSTSDTYCIKIKIAVPWTCIEDPDENFNADNTEINKVFGDLLSDNILTPEEMKKFYADDPDGKVEKLRSYVCKFVSEWGIIDIKTAVADLKKCGWAATEADYAPYLWWQDVIKAGISLPSSHVWHYNPIRFLETIAQDTAVTRTQAPSTPSAQPSVTAPTQAATTSTAVGVQQCDGPATADINQKVIYKVTKFSGTPTSEQKKSVNWVIKINGEERKKVPNHGDFWELDIPDTYAGDEIHVHPYINKINDNLLIKTKIGPYLLFDGKELTYFDHEWKKIKSWAGTSGENSITDQSKEHGPIPEGKYFLDQKDIQALPDRSIFDKMAGDDWSGGEEYWGKRRIQIFSYGAKTFGRMRFYIHGGSKGGSGFGIDLTKDAGSFIQFFQDMKKNLVLKVKYSSAPSPVSQVTESNPSTSDVHTDWKNGFERNITDQNKYNEFIKKAAAKENLDPLILKSLIAQESSFNPKAHNDGGFAGLTQIGGDAISEANLNIGGSKSVTKVNFKKQEYKGWDFDFNKDERFDVEKSVNAGAKILRIKMNRIESKIFKNFSKQPDIKEKMKFSLAAYNAGEGTVTKAYLNLKKTDVMWAEIIHGGSDSALWKVIPEHWGKDAKYKEITEYVENIINRRYQ